MLASHTALWLLTGSLAMFVFHTLSAGTMGQPAAPGTLVPPAFAARRAGPGAGARVALVVFPADGVGAPEAAGAVGLGTRDPTTAGAAAQPARQATAVTVNSVRRTAKCPVRMLTVASWHGYIPGMPGNREVPGGARNVGARGCCGPLQCNPWRLALCVN